MLQCGALRNRCVNFYCCRTSSAVGCINGNDLLGQCPSLTVSVLQGARQTAGPPVTRSAADQTHSGRAAMFHPSRTESGPAFRFTDRKANHDLENHTDCKFYGDRKEAKKLAPFIPKTGPAACTVAYEGHEEEEELVEC